MAHMVRKQIYIQKRQQALLKRLARARGVSEAELIREAIDREAMKGATQSMPGDPAALEEVIRFALARRELGSGDKPYQWNRADAYEERLSRFDRRAQEPSS